MFFLLTFAVSAHTLFMGVENNEDGTVTVTGMFSDGSSSAGLEFRLEDMNGKIILKDKMDQFGEFSFKIPDLPYFIVIDGGPGHCVREKGPKNI
jgi:hypothetical protein